MNLISGHGEGLVRISDLKGFRPIHDNDHAWELEGQVLVRSSQGLNLAGDCMRRRLTDVT